MSIALGIDTGGTYTDAVLVEYESNRVLASAKALTTKHDLAIGIRQAIAAVLTAAHKENAAPPDVRLVSLSTTLATNAIVEGNGAPVCALLIGYRDRLGEGVDIAHELGISRYALIAGGHLDTGEEWQPLDLEAARAAICEHRAHVAAFAISGYFGTRNPAHELAVKALVQELTDLPATCGHELTHRLDALRRATTVTLNGRLIPLLRALITAVERTMIEQGIRAPLMVVKGDGSLMEASMAKERPIETILSGPAASVVGAQHLAGGSHALVVDMGGTTTDVAVIQDGRPSLSPQGAQVGRWRTMVEAIDVHTVGLGGDSYVRLDENCDLHVGPRRVVPLCLLASEHPALVGALEQQLARAKATGADGEFIVYQRPDAHPEGERFSFEPELWAELRQGPRTLERVYQIMRYPQMYARYLERLERQGIVVRAAFTPTDAAHVLGRYQAWDGAAARLGAELLARRLGLSAEEVAARVLALTAERIATEVVAKLLHDDIGNGHHAEGDTVDSALIARALRPLQEAALHCALTVKPTLVAIGAPVNTYFPQVAQLLHAPLRIPHHTEVANAIGAVVGSVVYRVRALVMPQEDEGYRVHLPDQVRLWATLPEALDYAETQARAMALAGAQRSGAEDIRVQVERRDHSAPVATGWGEEVYLQTDLEVTAVGRPRLALR